MKSYKFKIQDGDLETLGECDLQFEILSPELYMNDWETGLPVIMNGFILKLMPLSESAETFLKLKYWDRISELV